MNIHHVLKLISIQFVSRPFFCVCVSPKCPRVQESPKPQLMFNPGSVQYAHGESEIIFIFGYFTFYCRTYQGNTKGCHEWSVCAWHNFLEFSKVNGPRDQVSSTGEQQRKHDEIKDERLQKIENKLYIRRMKKITIQV